MRSAIIFSARNTSPLRIPNTVRTPRTGPAIIDGTISSTFPKSPPTTGTDTNAAFPICTANAPNTIPSPYVFATCPADSFAASFSKAPNIARNSSSSSCLSVVLSDVSKSRSKTSGAGFVSGGSPAATSFGSICAQRASTTGGSSAEVRVPEELESAAVKAEWERDWNSGLEWRYLSICWLTRPNMVQARQGGTEGGKEGEVESRWRGWIVGVWGTRSRMIPDGWMDEIPRRRLVHFDRLYEICTIDTQSTKALHGTS
mmetsp:Transcript_20106/g.53592  ORF Transcript_20106/g.53592 Transcript_20106/m.53592 type:complete len:258 (+) Transcript_20106:159-932(+)